MVPVVVEQHVPPERFSQSVEVAGKLSTSLLSSLRLSSQALAREAVASRHYATMNGSTGLPVLHLDPRFLVFEFLLGFVLRRRQVELVNSLVSRYADGWMVIKTVLSWIRFTLRVFFGMMSQGNCRIVVCSTNDHGTRENHCHCTTVDHDSCGLSLVGNSGCSSVIVGTVTRHFVSPILQFDPKACLQSRVRSVSCCTGVACQIVCRLVTRIVAQFVRGSHRSGCAEPASAKAY